MHKLIIPAIWVVWAVIVVVVLTDAAQGKHRTPPLPVRQREDGQYPGGAQ